MPIKLRTGSAAFKTEKMDEKYFFALLCVSVTVEEKCPENTERKLDMEARMRHHHKKSKIDHKRKSRSGNPHRWRRYMSGGWRQYLEARKTSGGGNIWKQKTERLPRVAKLLQVLANIIKILSL